MNKTENHDQTPWVLDVTRVALASKQRERFHEQLKASGLAVAVENLFSGDIVNPSEHQPALHMALRSDRSDQWPDESLPTDLSLQRERFLKLADRLHSGAAKIADLVHIGIGGSDLGPRLLSAALGGSESAVRVHFLSTLDYRALQTLLASLDPATTGLLVASKSFTTEETMLQARAVADWMGEHFIGNSWAATTRADRAQAFGFGENSVLEFPAWTGGRFSMWSSVSTSAAATMGRSRFESLLAGASAADSNFHRASLQGCYNQLAHQLACLIHGLRRDLNLPTLGVVAYDPRLTLLGDYLQQLLMESLGKRVDFFDRPVEAPTAPLVFSGRGTDAQHAMFQAFHQGTDAHPLILVGTLNDPSVDPEWQRTQLAHLLGQAEALAHGVRSERACKELPGGRPVSLLMTETLTPWGLGYLLASFEHAVFVLAVLWGINPFDQWGVEEGKRLARAFKKQLETRSFGLDDIATAAQFLKESE